MASSATTTVPSQSTHLEATEERRPQAGPLPRKRGEIGYQEGVDGGDGEQSRNDDTVTPLPPRHPADREPDRTPVPEGPDAPAVGHPVDVSPPPVSSASSDTDASSLHKPPKRVAFLSWLDPRPLLKRTNIGGVRLGTVLRLSLQLAFLAGTIALWIVATRVLSVSHDNSSPATGSGSDSGSGSQPTQPPSPGPILGGSAAIFLHITFGVVTLAQLLFLERCIFFVRAQRYAHKHHGASLPTHGRHRSRNGSAGLAMSFAPWNRPPLPTYAAALAQSGVGTGDAEDNLIAIPPPPAYGNTRDSTLLLSGFMRNSLRAIAPRDSAISRPASQASRLTRPVSYRSHDEEWEQRCDAERALHLAETLEALENSTQPFTVSERAR